MKLEEMSGEKGDIFNIRRSRITAIMTLIRVVMTCLYFQVY